MLLLQEAVLFELPTTQAVCKRRLLGFKNGKLFLVEQCPVVHLPHAPKFGSLEYEWQNLDDVRMHQTPKSCHLA